MEEKERDTKKHSGVIYDEEIARVWKTPEIVGMAIVCPWYGEMKTVGIAEYLSLHLLPQKK